MNLGLSKLLFLSLWGVGFFWGVWETFWAYGAVQLWSVLRIGCFGPFGRFVNLGALPPLGVLGVWVFWASGFFEGFGSLGAASFL